MSMAALRNFDLPTTYVEIMARNGGENVRNSLLIMRKEKLAIGAITAVAHATSLRRLASMAEHESTLNDTPFSVAYRKPSSYDFNASNPNDQSEAIAEMKRLIDWPSKGWLRAGSEVELPDDLVDFAEDISASR